MTGVVLASIVRAAARRAWLCSRHSVRVPRGSFCDLCHVERNADRRARENGAPKEHFFRSIPQIMSSSRFDG